MLNAFAAYKITYTKDGRYIKMNINRKTMEENHYFIYLKVKIS